jgi:predicted HicB family RNase H-like nuclease
MGRIFCNISYDLHSIVIQPKKTSGKLQQSTTLSLRKSNNEHRRAHTKPKTKTASFRLDESALQTIQGDAQKQNVSVNTLLNQLVLTYANYDRPMKRFRMIKLPASSFKHILQAATDEAIIEAGNSTGKDVPNTYIVSKWGELTVENALNYLKITADHTNLFEYSEIIRDGMINVTLTHDFGAKGSLFLQRYVQAIFEQLNKRPKFSPDENAVAFELR